MKIVLFRSLLLSVLFTLVVSCSKNSKTEELGMQSRIAQEFMNLAIAKTFLGYNYHDILTKYKDINLDRLTSFNMLGKVEKELIQYVLRYDKGIDTSNMISKWKGEVRVKKPSDPAVEKQINLLIPELIKLGVPIKVVTDNSYNVRMLSFCKNLEQYKRTNDECIDADYLTRHFMLVDKTTIQSSLYPLTLPIKNVPSKVKVAGSDDLITVYNIIKFDLDYVNLWSDKRVESYVEVKPFTYYEQRDKVDGFVVNDFQGNIKFGECYIYAGHHSLKRKYFATECLLRVLGLTGSGKDSLGLLGNGFVSEISNISKLKNDFLMVSLLYNKRVRPGASYEETLLIVREILKQNKIFINHFIKG